MKYLRTTIIFAFLLFILFLTNSSVFAQSPKSKGKYTKKIKSPVCAHIRNEWDEGKVKRIRGKLVGADQTMPTGSIISIYKITDDKSVFIYSYLVGAKGEFDFKDLKDGTYFLKTGTTDGAFNQLDVKVILARKDKESSDEDLEIWLEAGT